MAKLSLAKLERHLYSAADRLRQEGLDAATYKDYIFGLLFLKRCSDVFEAERERIVGRKVEQGMFKEVAETQYGENLDFYDGFFVPEFSRWDYLQTKLGDATEPYGSVLDKALGALSERNESLEHVLDHIRVAVDRNLCEPVFLHAIFNSEQTMRQVNRDKGRGTREGMNTEQISSLTLALPPIEGQRRAIAVLVNHDANEHCETALLAKLSKLKSGLMADLLTGRVRVPESLAVVENQP